MQSLMICGITSNTILNQAEWSCIVSQLCWIRQSRWYPVYASCKGADNTWSATEAGNLWGILPKASTKPDSSELTPLQPWALDRSLGQDHPRSPPITGSHWFSLTVQLYLFCQAMARSPQELTRTSSSLLPGKQGRASFLEICSESTFLPEHLCNMVKDGHQKTSQACYMFIPGHKVVSDLLIRNDRRKNTCSSRCDQMPKNATILTYRKAAFRKEQK